MKRRRSGNTLSNGSRSQSSRSVDRGEILRRVGRAAEEDDAGLFGFVFGSQMRERTKACEYLLSVWLSYAGLWRRIAWVLTKSALQNGRRWDVLRSIADGRDVCDRGELFCFTAVGHRQHGPRVFRFLETTIMGCNTCSISWVLSRSKAWMLVFRVVAASLCANRFVLTPQGFIKTKRFQLFPF